MTVQSFEKLTVLGRFLESDAGCTELCRDEAGAKKVRIRICSRQLQECLLLQTDGSIPVQCSNNCLELLTPWQEGRSLKEWLLFEKPSFARRKLACVQLLEQVLTQPIPSDLLALSARTQNLRFGPNGLRLQLFPDLTRWNREMGKPEAIRRVAELMAAVLSDDLRGRMDQECPDELNLMLSRSRCGEYRTWEMLQADLYRIPDHLVSRARKLLNLKNRTRKLIQRCQPALTRIAVAVLALAAAVSALGTLHRQQEPDHEQWIGLTRIGLEVLSGEEDETPWK